MIGAIMYRDISTRLAWHSLGTPYIWGGDDPIKGFDCSGFVIELMRSVNKLNLKGDWTAQGLYELYKRNEVSFPQEGILVFWGKNKKTIRHIEYCINEDLSIGASGGGSQTNTEMNAARHNAYIKIRPIRRRPGIVAYVDPFRKE